MAKEEGRNDSVLSSAQLSCAAAFDELFAYGGASRTGKYADGVVRLQQTPRILMANIARILRIRNGESRPETLPRHVSQTAQDSGLYDAGLNLAGSHHPVGYEKKRSIFITRLFISKTQIKTLWGNFSR